jgi:hypothetical protein
VPVAPGAHAGPIGTLRVVAALARRARAAAACRAVSSVPSAAGIASSISPSNQRRMVTGSASVGTLPPAARGPPAGTRMSGSVSAGGMAGSLAPGSVMAAAPVIPAQGRGAGSGQRNGAAA